jgi:hypothetical protein
MTEISPIALLGSKDSARRFSPGLEADITQTIAGPGFEGLDLHEAEGMDMVTQIGR